MGDARVSRRSVRFVTCARQEASYSITKEGRFQNVEARASSLCSRTRNCPSQHRKPTHARSKRGRRTTTNECNYCSCFKIDRATARKNRLWDCHDAVDSRDIVEMRTVRIHRGEHPNTRPSLVALPDAARAAVMAANEHQEPPINLYQRLGTLFRIATPLRFQRQ